jgi:hypothetical protein
VVLASGGIDSSLCLALAGHGGGPVVVLGFDYGQRNRIELERLEQIASRLGCEMLVVPLDMRRWAPAGLAGNGAGTNGGSLTNLFQPAISRSSPPEQRLPRRAARSGCISALVPRTCIIPNAGWLFSTRFVPPCRRGCTGRRSCGRP